MTDDQLIMIAKKLAANRFAQNDEEQAVVARLTDIQVRTAAIVKFRELGNKKQSVDVYLDKDTGEFITGSLTLGHKSERRCLKNRRRQTPLARFAPQSGGVPRLRDLDR